MVICKIAVRPEVSFANQFRVGDTSEYRDKGYNFNLDLRVMSCVVQIIMFHLVWWCDSDDDDDDDDDDDGYVDDDGDYRGGGTHKISLLREGGKENWDYIFEERLLFVEWKSLF